MNSRKVKEKLILKDSVKKVISKFLLTIILFLLGMIVVKNNPDLKSTIRENIYENSFAFIKGKVFYEKYFGKIFSLDKIVKEEEPVFSEKLSYSKALKYYDGVKLDVSKNYMVPILESGVVVFIGNKEKYGNTIIIEQIDGIDTSYSNINVNNIKLYDYVEKGELLGETKSDKLFLSFQKDGKYLNYKKYI